MTVGREILAWKTENAMDADRFADLRNLGVVDTFREVDILDPRPQRTAHRDHSSHVIVLVATEALNGAGHPTCVKL